MDVGTAITASTAIITSVGGGVAIVHTIFKSKNGNGHCSDHSGLCAKQDGFAEWLKKIEAKLDRVIEQRTAPRVNK